MTEDLTFASGGARCAALLVRPDGVRGRVPCVVLAHGFDGVVAQRLDVYARRFADAGLAALAFDYRYFGASEGLPRQLVDNARQLDDWRAAIAAARALDGIDADRIALWGTSTSGGHVVKLAAEDPAIAAVACQMPLVDGVAQLRATPLPQTVKLLWAGLRDRVGGLLGRPPLYLPAAGRPGSRAVVTSADALSGLAAITPPDSTWRNDVVARFTLTTALYRPGRAAARVACPLLACVADGDDVIPAAPALALAARAPRGELRRYAAGHFAMYAGPAFERAVADQAAFLQRHLLDGAQAGAAAPVALRAVGS